MPITLSLKTDDPSHIDDLLSGAGIIDRDGNTRAGTLPSLAASTPAMRLPAGAVPALKPNEQTTPYVRGGLFPLPPFSADDTAPASAVNPRLALSTRLAAPVNPGPLPQRPLLGAPALAVNEAAQSKIQRPSLLRRTEGVLGKIGEVAGSALIPGVMPWIPGTRQHEIMETRVKERTAQEEAETSLRKAQADQAEAEAQARKREWSKPVPVQGGTFTVPGAGWEFQSGGGKAESPEDRARMAERYGLKPDSPGYQDYVLTGKLPTERFTTGRPEVITGADNKEYTVTTDAQGNTVAKPLMGEPQMMPAIGEPGNLAYVPPTPMIGQQIVAPPKAEKAGSDVNESIANYFRLKGYNPDPNSPGYAAHWQEAHQAYTNETKTQPGVVRIDELAATRGMPVTDTQTGITQPMSWKDYNAASKQFPGRYVSPAYDEVVQSSITAARGLAPKNTGQQVQSYGTFIGHAADLYSAIDSLKNTDAPLLNRPINWLRTNAAGDPRIPAFLAKLDPVLKEFESFLLNNRALYEEDRQTASKIINENASPAQMLAVMPSLVNTATIRLAQTNEAYRRASGKDVPNLLSKDTVAAYKKMGLEYPKVAEQAKNAELPDSAAKLLKEGVHTTFGNGQTWTLQNGKPVQVAGQ